MQFKLVPEAPADLDAVREAHDAVPLVPGSEDDCCARLGRRCGYPSRDVSRTWLTFLRALELAEETPSGFKRLRTDPTPEHLRNTFLENVFLAEDALEALVATTQSRDTGSTDIDDPVDDDSVDTNDPVDVDGIFARVRDAVPTWEHHKNPDTWTGLWRDRIGDHLDWFVLLGLATERDGGYVATARAVRRDGKGA